MAPVKNGRVLFNEIPTGVPEPGKATVYDDTETIDLDNVPLNGGILVKTLSLSIDPYLRGKMRDASIPSYSPAFPLGQPIFNDGVALVLRSENKAVKPGDHIVANINFQEYNIVKPDKEFRVVKSDAGIPWGAHLGVLGMPGRTAYVGWKEFAFPQKGDVVFVSGGAGPVGTLVIQIAKAEGLKVITSAGTDEKVAFLKSIGADVAFNYKTQKMADVLEKEGPINIFWDHVGGETFETALYATAHGARVIICGFISSYNGNAYGIKNLHLVIGRELRISGFLIGSLWPKYRVAFEAEMPKQVAEGKIKHKVHVTQGLEQAGQALKDVLQGVNNGKMIVEVADD